MTLQYPCQTLHFHFIPSSPGGQPVCKNRRAFILSTCTNRFLRFCFYIPIIVDFTKKVVASQATIPPWFGLKPPWFDLLIFYNFASPFVRTLRNAAHASRCVGFRSFAFFCAKNRQTRYCYHYTPGDSFFDKLSLTQLPILTVYPLQFSFFAFWQLAGLTLRPVSLVTGKFSSGQ